MVDGAARRRSGAVLDEAIRTAVRAELADRGYSGLTFEGVARRAGTSKPVVYRRYSSRALMVVDAWASVLPTTAAVIDTGTLRGDLVALCQVLSAQLDRVGIETFRGLIAEADVDLLAQIGDLTMSMVDRVVEPLLAAARARGEIESGPRGREVVMVLVKVVRHDLLFSGGVDIDEVTRMVDEVCLPLLRRGA